MSTKPLATDYDKDPFPNPNPKQFHGVWTHWRELHDQKALDKDANYRLLHNAPVPEGGLPFFVEQTHPSTGGGVRVTDDSAKARSFRGAYLLGTMWEWERDFKAVKA